MKQKNENHPILLTYTERNLRGGMESVAGMIKNVFPGLQVIGKESLRDSMWVKLSFPLAREPMTSLALADVIGNRQPKPPFIFTSGMHGWALPSRKTVIPTIALMHGPDPCFADAAFKKNDLGYWRMRYIYAWFERQSAMNADMVIANSHFTQRTLKSSYGVDSRVLELPIDRATFYPSNRDQARKRIGWPLEEKCVLFVGNPTYSKGWDVFLSLAQQNPTMRFIAVLVSPPPKTESNIQVVQSLERSALADYYRAADVLVFPSRFEGFGLVPMEALACDCPVVAAEVGVFHDFKPKGYFQATHARPSTFQTQLQVALNSKDAHPSHEVHARFDMKRYTQTLRKWVEELVQKKEVRK